ncbi:hypothetical protein GCM10027447_18390 [Glycomyces halotolerans]
MKLRSGHWYAGRDCNAYIHRAWRRRGVPGDAFDGRASTLEGDTVSNG